MFDLIKNAFGLGLKEPKVLSAEERAEILATAREYLAEKFALGCERDEARAYALEVLAGEMSEEELAAEVDAFLPEVEAERTAEMATWPAITDCDRLDEAFADLKASGLLAEQNFWCCGTCALSDINATLKKAKKSGGEVPRGYTFYHEQDTEQAVWGNGVCLNYGAEQRGDAASVAIGREVVATLERHGLQPEWDGDLDKRILVPLDWKRRKPLPRFY
ncbi:MAG: hypothetical protein AAF251_18110 [Pseudomonadota bacterium]